MSHWTEDWREESQNMKGYVHELEKRFEQAVEALKAISMGVGHEPTWSNPTLGDNLKYRAAVTMKQIIEMPQRARPYLRS